MARSRSGARQSPRKAAEAVATEPDRVPSRGPSEERLEEDFGTIRNARGSTKFVSSQGCSGSISKESKLRRYKQIEKELEHERRVQELEQLQQQQRAQEREREIRHLQELQELRAQRDLLQQQQERRTAPRTDQRSPPPEPVKQHSPLREKQERHIQA